VMDFCRLCRPATKVAITGILRDVVTTLYEQTR
jgi:hypothetical protein